MDRRKFLVQTASGIALAGAASLSGAEEAAAGASEENDQKGAATRILIENGVVVPMDGVSRSIDNQALLIDGNRISAIGDARKLMEEHSTLILPTPPCFVGSPRTCRQLNMESWQSRSKKKF